MLLSVHVTSSVLFLVQFNNVARLQAFIGVTRSYSSLPLLSKAIAAILDSNLTTTVYIRCKF